LGLLSWLRERIVGSGTPGQPDERPGGTRPIGYPIPDQDDSNGDDGASDGGDGGDFGDGGAGGGGGNGGGGGG
jgi:hypothetical protein